MKGGVFLDHVDGGQSVTPWSDYRARRRAASIVMRDVQLQAERMPLLPERLATLSALAMASEASLRGLPRPGDEKQAASSRCLASSHLDAAVIRRKLPS